MSSSTSFRPVRFLSPPFAAAVLLLGSAALLAGPVGGWMRLQQDKLPLPLKKPLSTLDESSIVPYRILQRSQLDPLVEEALGTKDYLNWQLEDASVPPTDPLRRATLFVTYDTGGRNLVPHTPDECFLGAGYQPSRPHETTELSIPSLIGRFSRVPARVCTFGRTAVFHREQVTVLYTFGCNGRFASSRTECACCSTIQGTPMRTSARWRCTFPARRGSKASRERRGCWTRCCRPLLRDHWPEFPD